MSCIYVVGSLRHPYVRQVGTALRAQGHEVFDDWHGVGPKADEEWQKYETERGRSYQEALEGELARHAFELDKKHLDKADVGVLVLPAGKDAHGELGYLKGRGCKTFVLMEAPQERWSLMYRLHDRVVGSLEELIGLLKPTAVAPPVSYVVEWDEGDCVGCGTPHGCTLNGCAKRRAPSCPNHPADTYVAKDGSRRCVHVGCDWVYLPQKINSGYPYDFFKQEPLR